MKRFHCKLIIIIFYTAVIWTDTNPVLIFQKSIGTNATRNTICFAIWFGIAICARHLTTIIIAICIDFVRLVTNVTVI